MSSPRLRISSFAELDPAGVDVDADHACRPLGERAADRGVAAPVLEHRLAGQRKRLLDPGDQVLGRAPAPLLPAVGILAGLPAISGRASTASRSIDAGRGTIRRVRCAACASGAGPDSAAPDRLRALLELPDPRLRDPAALLERRDLGLAGRQSRQRRGRGRARLAEPGARQPRVLAPQRPGTALEVLRPAVEHRARVELDPAVMRALHLFGLEADAEDEVVGVLRLVAVLERHRDVGLGRSGGADQRPLGQELRHHHGGRERRERARSPRRIRTPSRGMDCPLRTACRSAPRRRSARRARRARAAAPARGPGRAGARAPRSRRRRRSVRRYRRPGTRPRPQARS